jgi:hypothetical protein
LLFSTDSFEVSQKELDAEFNSGENIQDIKEKL